MDDGQSNAETSTADTGQEDGSPEQANPLSRKLQEELWRNVPSRNHSLL